MRAVLRRVLPLALLFLAGITAEAKDVAKKDSITICGRVLCDGVGVPNVGVSDGVHIVQTDSLGNYAIASHKFQNTVFVITPSGYEPKCRKRILPRFWSPLQKKRDVKEQHDFHLVKRENSSHRVLFLSNLRLQNSSDDLMLFKRKIIPAVKGVAEEIKDSMAIYTFLLGDISMSRSWYSREFDVTDAVSTMATMRYPTMLYTVMGGNDNDGAVPCAGLTDYEAERMYVMGCGPKYYSLNIGDVHYVVLDNSVFRNEPGNGRYPAEIVGKCNFDRFVTSDQLAWLRKDLALLKDKSKPVVVCMSNTAIIPGSKGKVSRRFTRPEQVDSLVNCFKGFKNVHFVTSGSWTRRVTKSKEMSNITEHSLMSTSGNGWGTGYNGFRLIHNSGADAGFEVADVDKKRMSWYPYSYADGRKPFRVYDMSSVAKYSRENADMDNLYREYSKQFTNYSKGFDNFIYVNYWGSEPKSKIEIFENDKKLRVRQIWQTDPLYMVISSAYHYKNARQKPRYGRNNSPHLFRAKRDSLTSTVRVRTTTPDGVVHEEIFKGEKDFQLELKQSRRL